MSLSFVIAPSSRLSQLLLKHNLKNPVYVLEYCENIVTNRRPEAQSVKKTLNSVSGVYLCINLVNGNMYVGSAYLNNMFRRFRGHLYLAAGGSKIVNNSVLKYGLINFAFIVIETIPILNTTQDKKALLLLEQKYLDLLKPAYNILKKAGSVLNLKWSLESRKKLSLSIINNKNQMLKIKILNLGKTLSLETRELIKISKLNKRLSSAKGEKLVKKCLKITQNLSRLPLI